MDSYLKGKVIRDAGLKKYAEDRSPYKIMPVLAAKPKDEEDVQRIFEFSKSNKLPITSRGAGSNLCGSCLGSGVIIDFSDMKNAKSHGSHYRVEPGIVYDDLNKIAAKDNFILPYSPSSGAFCTIGGNVGTKAAGLRSVKYGSVDNFVKSVRFINSQGKIIDTSAPLPPDLERKILTLRKELLADKKTLAMLSKKEKMKTSSGYNIFALYKYHKAEEIATHLMVGSAGTLGMITSIDLELSNLPKSRTTAIAYFKTLEQACSFVLKVKKLGPSAIEILDSFSLKILREHSKYEIPSSEAALLIEFDSKFNIKALNKLLGSSVSHQIEYDLEKQQMLWNIRRDLLTIVEKKNKNVIAFVEDIGVPPENLAKFIKDLQKIFTKNKVEVVIFGHAGEGNLHLRPIINKAAWKEDVSRIADLCYKAAFKHGGTSTCEHGMGRNKSPYIRAEWGPKVITYFKKIKEVFDPQNIFNPEINFDGNDITKDMKY